MKRQTQSKSQLNATFNSLYHTTVPRGILSFRPADPINEIIKLETCARGATATRVISDAVAGALGGKYRGQAAHWRGLLASEQAVRLEKKQQARLAQLRRKTRVLRATKRQAAAAVRAARDERQAHAKLLLKTEGVDAGQIPVQTVERPVSCLSVDHTVLNGPDGETTSSMPESPALPVAAQSGLTLGVHQ